MRCENDLLAQSAHAFLDGVAKREPTPGGGSVAAAVGALAVALSRMVVSYSAGKRTGDDEAAQAKHAADQLAHADRMLRRLVSEDAAAYRSYMAARKSGDPDEQAQATGVAIAVPLEIAAVACSALAVLDRFKEASNRNLVSDLGIAALLTEASVQAAAYNIRINLRDADQADPKGEVREEMERLLEHARRARESIAAFADRYL